MADTVIGVSLQADDQVSPKVKNIKQALREAQTEVMTLSEKFGATSKEAAAAAKKAAQLKDAIGDARSLVDAFNPDTKFRAFGAAINTVTGGFTALTGAMALLGVESEDVQKTLLKVQSALAISQGVAQLQEGIQSFKNLKSVLINTLGKSGAIGLAIAGVAALGYAIWEAVKGTDKLAESQKEFGKGAIQASKEISLLKGAIDQAKAGVLSKNEALKQFNETIGKVTGSTNDLGEAERLVAENAENYIKVQGLKAQANFLLQKSAQESAEWEVKRLEIMQSEIPEEMKQRLLGQIKEEMDGLNIYSDAIDSITKKIASVKFSVTTTGLGSAFGGGVKKEDSPAVKANKEDKKKELDTDINFWATKLGIDLTNRQSLASNALAMRRILLDGQAEMDDEELAAAQEQYYALRQADADYNAAIEASQQLAFDNKQKMLQAIASGLSSLSELVGRETAAGKVMAAAGAAIDTYAAINATLKNTAKTPAGGIPGYAIAQAIATGIFGLVQVKKILSTKVPGKGGSGGGSAPSVSAPLQAQLPQAATTRLDQNSLNQIGNATTRAFVVESDVTGNQERIRRLNRAAKLG